jgi:SAM-dependent methyltransferase
MRPLVTAILLLLAVAPGAVAALPGEPTRSEASSRQGAPASAREGAREGAGEELPRLPDVPFVVTPEEVVETMLWLAETGPRDIVYDLGCGDGRIVIAAVRDFGARQGVCVEIDPDLLAEARENAREAGVAGRIRFVEGDLFEVSLADATVVTLYLLPEINLRLRPKLLRELAPGSRVVSHDFGMGDWRPQEALRVRGRSVFLWTIPAASP